MSRFIIGLTGPTGAGKSTVAEAAAKLGFTVIDADKIARRAVLPQSPIIPELCKNFGDDILQNDGTLNRKMLAKRAFGSRGKTDLLNSIMLPYISQLIENEIELLAKSGQTKIILDAPTLFESGLDRICNCIIAVLCPVEIRKQRILSRDNLSVSDAEIRLSAGKPDSFYTSRTKNILQNIGSAQEIYSNATILLTKLENNQ